MLGGSGALRRRTKTVTAVAVALAVAILTLVTATALPAVADDTSAITVTTTNLAAGEVGVAYQVQLNAAPPAATITWTLETGTPPAGLGLSASGVISGTPTAAGTTQFTVRATNTATSDTDTQDL